MLGCRLASPIDLDQLNALCRCLDLVPRGAVFIPAAGALTRRRTGQPATGCPSETTKWHSGARRGAPTRAIPAIVATRTTRTGEDFCVCDRHAYEGQWY